jgi:hypothetical protein
MLTLTKFALCAALMVAGAFFASTSFPQAKPNSSAITIQETRIQAASLRVALEQVATKYSVVIGLDLTSNSSSSKASAVDIPVPKGSSLGDLLNALLSGKPEYSWRERTDGSIYITTKSSGGEPVSLSQSRVSHFTLENTDLLDLAGAVEQLPEVQQWSRDNQCPQRRVVVFGGQTKSGKTVSLAMAEKPLWKILDVLAARTDSHFWEIDRYNLNGHWYCRITI